MVVTIVGMEWLGCPCNCFNFKPVVYDSRTDIESNRYQNNMFLLQSAIAKVTVPLVIILHAFQWFKKLQ